MNQQSDATRQIALLLGGMVLANLLIEGGLAIVVGNPLAPPFASTAMRFNSAAQSIPSLAPLIGGIGLIAAACWNAPDRAISKRLGIVLLALAALALAPLILALMAYGPRTVGAPAEGMLKLRIQMVRIILFSTTLSGMCLVLGRLLLRKSRQETPVSSFAS